MCEAKCPILMMKSANLSLEDIFLELTADQVSAPSLTEEKESNHDSDL